MKRIITIVLVLSFAISLTACGDNNVTPPVNDVASENSDRTVPDMSNNNEDDAVISDDDEDDSMDGNDAPVTQGEHQDSASPRPEQMSDDVSVSTVDSENRTSHENGGRLEDGNRLFNQFTITNIINVSVETEANYPVYFTNAPTVLTANKDISAAVLKITEIPSDDVMGFPWSYPGWDEREWMQPISGEWVEADAFYFTAGSEFLLESGVYIVMVYEGMDDNFLIVVE